MTSKEIQTNLLQLTTNLNLDEFIYDLLLAYGISKTSINRLKKGDFNFSKIPGEVLYKNKVFYTTAPTDLHLKVEEYAIDNRILKQNPRFIIVTDNETLVAKDLKTKLNRDFPIVELANYYDFFLPLSGAEVYKASNDNKADRDAAYKLAQLYDLLVQDNPHYQQESHQLNIFLSRLLFCFFAEDTGIFEKTSIFTETLSLHTAKNGTDVDEFLNTLFNKLNTKAGDFPAYLNDFPYVNGGLFSANIKSPIFSAKARQILLSCGDLDWSEINPDIFGSMIQAVADPEERSDLGMHYTSVPNIKKLIEPLFLDELREELEKNRHNAKALDKLLIRLSKIKFFDPACGSGNFLIITYKEIRLLEIEIIKQIIEISSVPNAVAGGSQAKIYFTADGHKVVAPASQAKMNFSATQSKIWFTEISLIQFYGIEIKDFAHEMAILSLWLAEHQMNKIFDEMLEGLGQSKPILPLKEAGNIVSGNATRLDWTTVCPRAIKDEVYILGNPPYLGSRNQISEQKDDMALVFLNFADYKKLDYISCWIYLSSIYIKLSKTKFAFVTTNSITQGEQAGLLWPLILNNNQEIFYAHQSFKWENNAKGNAGVAVVIIGVRNVEKEEKFIFTQNVKKKANNISPYLADTENILVFPSKKSLSNFPLMITGSAPGDDGNLILDADEKERLTLENPKINKMVKKYVGAKELIDNTYRYCIHIKEENLKEALNINELKNRFERIKQFRLTSKKAATNNKASTPYYFDEDRYEEKEFILIPKVGSERREYLPIGYYDKTYLPSNTSKVIYNVEPLLFAVISSKMHIVWVKAIAGRLKTDMQYSNTLCYNTFPFPEINVKQKESLRQYVFDILDERAKFPEKTMAWLYNPDTMPSGLRQAHKALDLAIEQIYRLAPFNNDAERLAYLFKLYEEMTKKDTLFAKPKKEKKGKTRAN